MPEVTDRIRNNIRFRVDAVIRISEFKNSITAHPWELSVGLKFVKMFRDVIIDELCRCVEEDVMGRNQEERASAAVYKAMICHSAIGECDCYTADDRELILDAIDAIIQSMRFYNIGDSYEIGLRRYLEVMEGLEGCP